MVRISEQKCEYSEKNSIHSAYLSLTEFVPVENHCCRIAFVSSDHFSFSFLWCYFYNAKSKTTISHRIAAWTSVAFASIGPSPTVMAELQKPKRFKRYMASNYHKANRWFEYCEPFWWNCTAGLALFTWREITQVLLWVTDCHQWKKNRYLFYSTNPLLVGRTFSYLLASFKHWNSC